MKYPVRSEYDTAVRNLDKFVFDSILNEGKPLMQKYHANILRSYNGGKATVYEIGTRHKKYALKCWVEDLGDLKNRYKEIDDYLKKSNSPYFVDFSYNEEGILVNGSKFPIVRMEWVEGIGLKKFIANNINNPISIRKFADDFLEMVKNLHENNISHGDLQHENIMIRENGKICLIDYDSLCVPQLINEKDNIKGLPGYQHPNRNQLTKLSPKSDYFSELIIYLSLLALAEKPSYWQDIEKEERLLFSDDDFAKPDLSQIFMELKKLSPEIQYLTTELEKFCQEQDIENLQPLENLVTAYTGEKVSWDFASNTKPNLASSSPVKIDSDNWKLDTSTEPQTQTTIWDKLDNNKNIWDKFDSSQPGNGDVWDKINKQNKNNEVIFDTRKSENIWDKLLKSVSYIWNRILNWIKTLS